MLSTLNVLLACLLVWLSHGKFKLPNCLRYFCVKFLGKIQCPGNETEASDVLEEVINHSESKIINELLNSEKYAESLMKSKEIFAFVMPSVPKQRQQAANNTAHLNENATVSSGQGLVEESPSERFKQQKLKLLENMEKHLNEIHESSTYSKMKKLQKTIDAEGFAQDELKQLANVLNRICAVLFILINIGLFIYNGQQIITDEEGKIFFEF